MRPTSLRPSARQALTAKRLHTHHRTNHVAVDVNVAYMGGMGQGLGAAVDAGLYAAGQAITERVDLVDHIGGVASHQGHAWGLLAGQRLL